MNPIEFPYNDQYYLALAEEAFSKGEYAAALENYQQAYQEAPSLKLNQLIASLALEQGAFSTALEYAEEAAEDYLDSLESINLYLEIQLYAKRFFSAREFLWRAQKAKSITEGQKNRWLIRIDDQETFYQKQQQAAINTLEEQISHLPELLPMDQLTKVRGIRQLPEERLKIWADKWMLDPSVAPLVRSYLFESLARLGVSEKVGYLTLQGELVELIPAEIGIDDTLQNQILTSLSRRLGDQDPILLTNLSEQVRVEMAFLYPLQFAFTEPEAWTASYLAEYSGSTEVLEESVEKIRGKIKQAMLGYD